MVEFTGERVIPGEVDNDLWNEHLARYAFAARLAAGKRVLDAGCGAGYGTSELARTAIAAVGADVSAPAIDYARRHFPGPNISFIQCSCTALPLPAASVDVVTAFEVIEHVQDWQAFLAETRRVLAPGGTLIISTPNREYYAESRGLTGPNPYHVHEFDLSEFSAALRAQFPHVSLFLQNHVAAIGFQPCSAAPGPLEVSGSGGRTGSPEDSHFLLALCSDAPLPEIHAQLYVPATANVLRERERHIEMLETEREQLRQEKQNLVDMYRAQKAELEASNAWAREIDEKLERANAEKAEWGARLNAEIHRLNDELKTCIERLDRAEATVIERTEWALRLQKDIERLEDILAMVRASRWVKLGRKVGVGPHLDQD